MVGESPGASLEPSSRPPCDVRIRQVRPEFFTDRVMGSLTTDVRLTYIGLWCVADDAGWMTWDVDQIAAQLYPYESIHSRTRRVEKAREALTSAGRLVVHECGCAVVLHLAEHQKIGGNKSFTAVEKHESIHVRTSPSAPNVPTRPSNTPDARARAEADAPRECGRCGGPIDNIRDRTAMVIDGGKRREVHERCLTVAVA